MAEQQLAAVNLAKRPKLCEMLIRKRRTHCHCISTDKPPKRPDPAIYSQLQRLSQGLAASWESPDVQTNYWSPWRFMDSIVVYVRNESTESSAVNTLVQAKWAAFGIGTPLNPLGDQVINLGIAPDQQTLLFPVNDSLRALGNDVSIQINISHPHDKDVANNTGFQAIHGVSTSESGRSPGMTFAVVNASASTETITLVVLANDIAATVTPAVRTYAPNEQITATLSAVVPASITPPAGGYILKDATVVGYNSSGKILGGVTLLVRVDS
jgi:hypothetical protein